MFRPILKALTEMFHGGNQAGLLGFQLPGTGSTDYARSVSDGFSSNVLTAPILWIARQFPEAPPALKIGDEISHDNDLTRLLEKPNEAYSGEALMMATLFDFLTDGNGYWIKLKNTNGKTVQLWYTPRTMMEPRWPDDGSEFISHYEYSPGNSAPMAILPEDVVHLRYGIDPRNARKGFGLLKPLIREVFTDDEASRFTASVLSNRGIPGLVISPDKDVTVGAEDLQATKKFFQQEFSGSKRGRPLVMGAPTKVETFGHSPKDMDLGVLRNIPEERVCSQMGIPAAVVGFGTGLQSTKVGATMDAMIRLAWMNGIVPLQRLISAEITRSLVSEFSSDPDAKLIFDLSDVVSIQTAIGERAKTNSTMLKDGAITIAEYRADMGFEFDATHEIYLRPMNVIEVPVGKTATEVEAEATPDASEGALNVPNSDEMDENVDQDAGVDDDAKNAIIAGIKLLEDKQPTDPVGDSEITVEANVAVEGESIVAAEWQTKLVNDLDVITEQKADEWTGDLMKFFDDLGAAATAASIEVLGTEESPKARYIGVDWKPSRSLGKRPGKKQRAERDAEFKAAEDAAAADAILLTMAMAQIEEEWKHLYGGQYLKTARAVFKGTENVVGLGIGLDDAVAQDILAVGERRSLIVKIGKQTRDRVFKELSEGRALGEGINDLQARIREQVPAGRWGSPSVRARVIARTETAFARNASMVQFAKQVEGARMMIFDGRVANSDEVCQALDGKVVSIQEAEALTAEEHPNGTRSFSLHIQRGK